MVNIIDDGKVRIEIAPTIVLTAVLAALAYFMRDIKALMVMCLLSPILCVVATSDRTHHKIPNRIIALMIIPIILDGRFNVNPPLIHRIISAVIVFVPVFLLGIVTKKGIGGGDLKLLTMSALLLGYNVLVAIIVGFILLFAYLLVALATKKIDLKTRVAMGPAISLAVVAIYILANQIGYYH